jgi:drug/metabolite transporter (DMT)-like permease
MDWIVISVLAYLLLAVESVANKFLIVGKVKSWRLYLFYIGLLSLISLVLIPWGFVWPSWKVSAGAILSGIFFFAYLAVLFSSLKKWTASRVFVLMGAVNTLSILILALVFLGETFTFYDLVGIMCLIGGSFFISYRYDKLRLFQGYKWAILAGILSAISFAILKLAYDAHAVSGHNFVGVYIFSRFGITGMTLLLLLWPNYRQRVFSLLKKGKSKEQAENFGWVLLIKVLSGVAAVMVNYTVAVGSVTIVNALSAVQYLFIFFLSIILGYYFKSALEENLDRKNIFYKTVGAALVVAGIILVML